MKQKFKFALAFGLPILLAALPLMGLAAGEVERGLGQIRSPFSGFMGVGQARNVNDMILKVIQLLLSVAGAIAVLFIIIGGFMYMTAGGNAEQAEKGRNYLVNAVIGIVIIILSYVIINVVVGTLTRSGSWF